MTTFAVGEVAIFQNSLNLQNDGRECLIIGGLRERMGLNLITGESQVLLCYSTQTSDGVEWLTAPHQLRKRRPPSADESESRQAMLDCIERAKRGCEVPA